MLEQETERIIAELSRRTIADRDGITLGEVLQSDIPRSVKAYMRADVIRWIERDASAAPSLGRIDRSRPGIDQLARHFYRTLADAYRFPRDEYLVLLDHAVHFAENYLLRPQWTLISFLFGDAPVAEAPAIRSRLDYFGEYEYFPSLILRLLREPGPPVRAEVFARMLAEIDDQVTRQHSAGEFAQLLRPVFEFLHLAGTADEPAIPVKPILVFLDDKKMKILREYIERICGIRNASTITLPELASMIDQLFMGQTTEPPAASSSAETPPVAPPAVEEAPETAEPPVEPAEASAAAPPPPPETARTNIPLSLTFSGMSEHPSVEPPTAHGLPDLKVLISADMQDQYVRKVFMSDYDYFATVIAALNSFGTWDEAGSYLERLYELNGLDPARPEIQEFTSAVRKRYPEPGGDAR